MLGYSVPDNHTDKVGLDYLKKENRITHFMEKMNEAFKPKNQSNIFGVFCDFFVKLKKDNNKLKELIKRYDKLANIAKKHNMENPPIVLWLKILHNLNIENTDRKLVITILNLTS